LFAIFSSFLKIFFGLILNVILVGAPVVSHESDQVEVPPNHAMGDADWVHEGSKWKCKINGCTNAYATKWLFRQHLDNKHGLRMELGKSGCPFTRVGGLRQQNHYAMNARILSNPHGRQKQSEKKALDRAKKKAKLEWDELQAQAQQMEQVKRPLLVRLAFEILLGIIGIPTWGVGFIPQSAWACLEKDENLVETIRASRVAYAKPLKLAWGAWNWTLESNKCNRVKEMDAISKYHDSKIIHGRYISIFFFQF